MIILSYTNGFRMGKLNRDNIFLLTFIVRFSLNLDSVVEKPDQILFDYYCSLFPKRMNAKTGGERESSVNTKCPWLVHRVFRRELPRTRYRYEIENDWSPGKKKFNRFRLFLLFNTERFLLRRKRVERWALQTAQKQWEGVGKKKQKRCGRCCFDAEYETDSNRLCGRNGSPLRWRDKSRHRFAFARMRRISDSGTRTLYFRSGTAPEGGGGGGGGVFGSGAHPRVYHYGLPACNVVPHGTEPG